MDVVLLQCVFILYLHFTEKFLLQPDCEIMKNMQTLHEFAHSCIGSLKAFTDKTNSEKVVKWSKQRNQKEDHQVKLPMSLALKIEGV